jgi:hypothetical protein
MCCCDSVWRCYGLQNPQSLLLECSISPLFLTHGVEKHCTLFLLWLGSWFSEWLQQDCCEKGGRGLEAVTCETAPAEVSVDTFHACSAGHCKWGGHRWNHSHHSPVSTFIPNNCVFGLLLLAVCWLPLHFAQNSVNFRWNSSIWPWFLAYRKWIIYIEEIIKNYQPKLLWKFVLNNKHKLVCMYVAQRCICIWHCTHSFPGKTWEREHQSYWWSFNVLNPWCSRGQI